MYLVPWLLKGEGGRPFEFGFPVTGGCEKLYMARHHPKSRFHLACFFLRFLDTFLFFLFFLFVPLFYIRAWVL